MYKNSIPAIVAIATIYLFWACNTGTVTTEEKDSAMAVNADPGNSTMKMKDTTASPIATMTDEMKAMQMTNDFDQDFARVMILHHQAAVDMSQKALWTVSDAEIKKMAQTMVADHTAEIADLNKFLSTHGHYFCRPQTQ